VDVVAGQLQLAVFGHHLGVPTPVGARTASLMFFASLLELRAELVGLHKALERSL
jgi:hypothetical protein